MDKLIKELEKYRLENKITQQKLAKMLGVAFSTVNRWLNGRTEPSKIQSYHIRKLITNTQNEKTAPKRLKQKKGKDQ